MNDAGTTVFIDNETVVPIEKININVYEKEFEIALIGSHQTIQMIRITIPNVDQECFSESDLKVVQELKEHMLSILRLNYDSTANSPINVYSFRKTEDFADLSFTYNTRINDDFDIRTKMIIGSYSSSMPFRNQVKLLADSIRKEIPIQYRFLSLYKLLELEFKIAGKWTDEFNMYINEFSSDFEILGISSRTLENYIHELRDKCAHIKSNKDIVSITELSQPDSISMENFLPLMTKIAAIIINRRYSNENFGIQIH